MHNQRCADETEDLDAARRLEEHTQALNEVLSYNQELRDQLASKKAARLAAEAAKLAAKATKNKLNDNSVALVMTEQAIEADTISEEVRALKEQMAAIQKVIDQKCSTKQNQVSVKAPMATFIKVENIADKKPVAVSMKQIKKTDHVTPTPSSTEGYPKHVLPVPSASKKKLKDSDSVAPKPSSTEFLLINDCYLLQKDNIEIKEISYTSKTTGNQEVLKTCSPQLINYKGETYAWANAGKNAYSVQKWAV